MVRGWLSLIRPGVAGVLLLLCAAPAHAEPKPEWVDGPSAEHPSSKFLTGVGSGDTREEAAAQARAAIAAVFSSEITATVSSSESESTNGAGQESTHHAVTSASQQVQALSHAVLEGVEVAKAWTDSSTGREYVLAVLNRSKAMRALTDQETVADQELLTRKRLYDQAGGHLEKAKAAARLLGALDARRALSAQERVLSGSGAARPLPLDTGAVSTAASQTLSELSFAAKVSGADGSELSTAIVQAISALGYHAGVSAAQPDLRIDCAVETQPLEGDEERPSLKWVRTNAVVTLAEAATGKVVAQFNLSEKTASHDEREATRRTLAAIGRGLKPKLAQAVSGYLETP